MSDSIIINPGENDERDSIIINFNDNDEGSINPNENEEGDSIIIIPNPDNAGDSIIINNNQVNSINGKTGNVILNKSDIGLDQVDNISDLNKPISIATLTALSLKTDLSAFNILNNLVLTKYGSWDSVYAYVNSTSSVDANQKYATTFVITNSSNITRVNSLVNTTSSDWNIAYSFVISNSSIEANKEQVISFVNSNSSNIIDVNTLVNSNSSNIFYVNSFVNSNSSNVIGVNSFVNTNSSNILKVNTLVNNTSSNWDNAYIIATTYQNTSGNFATNVLLQSTSALLTPLTLTNFLTSQLVTNNTVNAYQTNVATSTGTLTPLTLTNFLTSQLVTKTVADSKFLPLSGGSLTGTLNTNSLITTTSAISSLNSQITLNGTAAGYGFSILNRVPFDPGQTLTVDGRGRVVHGMTFTAGITNFANGSDHSHVQWTAQNRSNWQMIQNGDPSASNNNAFVLTTVGPNANTQFFNDNNIYSVDSTAVSASPTAPYLATGIKINYNTNLSPNLTPGQFIQITFNPGAVGIVANTYSGTVSSGPTAVTINGSTKYQYTFSLENFSPANWTPSLAGTELVYLNANNVKNIRVAYSPTDINGTMVGLTGNYLGIPRYVLVEMTGHDAYAGETVILKITTTTKINLPPADYNAYVKHVIDANRFVLSVGNTREWFTTFGTTGGTGWGLYKGSTDGSHQYTPALQHFYYQRFPTSDTGTKTTGGNRNIALGNSAEVDGDFSYAFGYKSSIFPSTTSGSVSAAAILGGENNFVYGNNSTAVGGIGLVASGSNQFITGKYNSVVGTNSTPFIVGWGSSDTNRSNLLELTPNRLTLSTNISSNATVFANSVSASSLSGNVVSVNSLVINSAPQTFTNPVTASGTFLVININGTNKAIQLWDFTS